MTIEQQVTFVWGCHFQKSAYLTEVHHINGDGEDAGIVYCEMQARENTGSSRTHLELTRSMYPGHCGYKVPSTFVSHVYLSHVLGALQMEGYDFL